MLAPAFLKLLRCPADGCPLIEDGGSLVSAAGVRYPVVEGVPILLPPDASADTLPCVRFSRGSTNDTGVSDGLHLESLGCNDEEREGIRRLAALTDSEVDPVVNYLVAATCGNMYKHMIGKLSDYPIPKFRLTHGNGRIMVDIGCNWGRWCVAAGREGFQPLGIDPQLGAVLAAKRVASQLGIDAWFVCADARHLPLAMNSVDLGFSYSVLQHFSPADVEMTLRGLARVLKPGGETMIQMATRAGLKGLVHSARNGFREPDGFDVRYWRTSKLKEVFERLVGPTSFTADCFFGIGLQAADRRMMPPMFKAVITASEWLRKMPGTVSFADSIYVHSQKVAA